MKSPKEVISKKAFRALSIAQFALTILLALGIFYYHFGMASVPSESMEPTLNVGAVLIYKVVPAEQMTYDDIVLFFPEGGEDLRLRNGFDALANLLLNDQQVFVKRIIGLPGDIIEVKDGYAWRNGVRLDPPYVKELMTEEMEPYTVQEGHIFCMGDNRNMSLDSRYFGAFRSNTFFGKMVYSLNRPRKA